MKPFDALTGRGRLRRPRRLVLEALKQYELRVEMAARSLMFINHVAQVSSTPEGYIEDRCRDLQRLLGAAGQRS